MRSQRLWGYPCLSRGDSALSRYDADDSFKLLIRTRSVAVPLTLVHLHPDMLESSVDREFLCFL